MKSKIFVVLLLFMPGILLKAGDGEYAISKIPAELMNHANIVKRNEEIRFEVVDVGKAREYHKYVLTILNENGDKYANAYEFYDRLRSVESISGTLYDASGKKIKSLKKSDIEDLSGTSNINLADDNRIRYHNFYCKLYPYTVEYEIEVKYNYTMFFPRWDPQEGFNFSVQESKITVICPQDYHFRYKAFHLPESPKILDEKSRKSYNWEVSNLPPVRWEYAHPQWNEMVPQLYLGPDQFELGDYKGNMNSWQEFGKFIFALTQGRDQLPDDVKSKVHQLTDGLTDVKEKVRRLYEFMQENTRYVSVQLGIGGWQPFDANYVATRKYGDCKALSNYMFSLLKEAGIPSKYSLIMAGDTRKYMLTDFPSSQFNHVILCVPLAKDSIWLECTSQTLPAGYLSGFTADRYALMIDEQGGRLVHTPKYSYQDNLQTRKISASIELNGNLTANIQTRYRAIQQDELEGLINGLSKDKIMEFLKSAINLPTYDIVKFDYKEDKSLIPVIHESIELNAQNYAQVSGRRLFINPNILNRSRTRLETEEERKYDIELNNEYRDIDSVEIRIPSGFAPESIPQEMKIETKFGKYISWTKVEPGKIIYYRMREQYEGKYPAKDYASLTSYFEQIYRADQNQVVLVNQQ